MGASREVATWLGSKAATAALLGADCVNNRLEMMIEEGGDDRGWIEPKSERLQRELEWQRKQREYEESKDHEGKMKRGVVLCVHDRARWRRQRRRERGRKRVRWREEPGTASSQAQRHEYPQDTNRSDSQHQDEPNETSQAATSQAASRDTQPERPETKTPPLLVRYESSDDESSSDDEAIASNDGMPPLARRAYKEDVDETGWGLGPPKLSTGARIDGNNKRQDKRENKVARRCMQELQKDPHYWTAYRGDFELPGPQENPTDWKGSMCPKNLALEHPAANKLLQYATGGCPCNSGKPWTKEQMWEAVARGPHVSALEEDAIAQLEGEIANKVKCGQCRVVLWDDIKDNPPEQLKISPLAMIPHKSRKYSAILDLLFRLRLKNGSIVLSVNEATTLEAPAGAIDQMGHALQHIIHAFAEADEDAKIFMAKWDIKDGFWRMDVEEGEEWNFCYVLPQREGEPTRLVVPTSLQMGWVESPPYFCAASETARDVAGWYAELPMGLLPDHKFTKHAMGNEDVAKLPDKASNDGFNYIIEVYVDDFISLAAAKSKEQLEHIAKSVMHGVHDVFPADEDDDNDPLSMKKLLKLEGDWALLKEILGFEFDGVEKTMQLEPKKRDALLEVMSI